MSEKQAKPSTTVWVTPGGREIELNDDAGNVAAAERAGCTRKGEKKAK